MKYASGRNIEQSAAEAIRRILAAVGFLKTDIETHVKLHGGLEIDVMVRVKSPTSERMLIVEVKQSGQPMPARQALNQLFQATSSVPGAYGIFMAPYISPRSAQLCRDQGVGYADLAGNCHLEFDEVYIRVEGNGNPNIEKRELRSLYSPRAERVLRALLEHPGREWRLQEVASEADVSLGQAHNVKALLSERDWIRTAPSSGKTVLCDPAALLDEWAQAYARRKTATVDFFCLLELDEIEARLAAACAEACTDYAFTGLSAAARYAPFVRYQRVDAYVKGSAEPLISPLGLKRVPAGANVRVRMPYDDGVLYASRSMMGVQVVSPIQDYLDLCAEGGRAGDGAQFLREQIIEKAWAAA